MESEAIYDKESYDFMDILNLWILNKDAPPAVS